MRILILKSAAHSAVVLFADTTTTVNDMHLMSLIDPVVHDKYWRYMGSLTTPPLHESKVWSVFQNPLNISHRQVSQSHTCTYRNILYSARNECYQMFVGITPLNCLQHIVNGVIESS